MTSYSNLNDLPNQESSLRDYSIPADLFDVIKGWFERKGFTTVAAQVMATSLIAATIDNNGNRMDVMETLKTYEGSADLNEFTTYLLNRARVPTSFAGYELASPTNKIYRRLII
jgi:hypothetical protein